MSQSEGNFLELSFQDIFEKSLQIVKAGKYAVKLKKGLSFNEFALYISGLILPQKNEDILVNKISLKVSKDVRKYLQQNSLILSKNTFLNQEATLYQYLSSVSLMYSGYNLASAGLSSFLLNDIKNKKISYLTKNEKHLAILTNTIVCPSLIWFIENKLVEHLSKEANNIFQNAVNIRIKHGGVCIFLT